jgi:hypothetical protein
MGQQIRGPIHQSIKTMVHNVRSEQIPEFLTTLKHGVLPSKKKEVNNNCSSYQTVQQVCMTMAIPRMQDSSFNDDFSH